MRATTTVTALTRANGVAVEDPLTPPSRETVQRMRSQRRRDTKPELALRRELHRRGRRFFVDRAPLAQVRRRADLVFPTPQVAVFVDGCFWHACPQHGRVPRSNTAWWRDKLTGNAARDEDTDLRLVAQGWRVVRVWEHEPVSAAADRVERCLGPRPGRAGLQALAVT